MLRKSLLEFHESLARLAIPFLAVAVIPRASRVSLLS